MVLALTALIGIATTNGRPPAGEFALALAAMLFSQFAIGWSNDFLDREVDAAHQPWKPVPAGLVNARLMPAAIVLALLLATLAGTALGLVPVLLLTVGTLCGLLYNLGLKGTPFSGAAFVLAFAVLPVFVWTALDVFSPDLLLLYPIGLTLPVAVHVANVLPDIQTDNAQGRRTIAVRLGRSRSIAAVKAGQLWPVLLTAMTWPWLDYDEGIIGATLLLYVALSLTAAMLYARRGRPLEVWAFRAVAVGSVLFAGGWLAAR